MPHVTWIKGSRGSWAEILLGSPAVRSAERCWSVATVLKQGGGVTGLGPHSTEAPLTEVSAMGRTPQAPWCALQHCTWGKSLASMLWFMLT